MQIIEGDLIALAKAGRFDVIAHGCNCFCTMGAGIARAIAAAFPQAYEADRATEMGSRDKLGRFSAAAIDPPDRELTVVNAYTQYDFSGPGRLVDYDAVATVFARIATAFPTARIGYPLIGAGLAGGDWSRIAPLIDTALAGRDHALVILPGTSIPGGST
ncbi:hypothetical protein [Shimia biformata]|uniref:hypothetical protein n=1 Tax=Shimia biformata TaxID=1294299 RepID=UPI0019513053|nr:hypothetical protein [Shimia biformata]